MTTPDVLRQPADAMAREGTAVAPADLERPVSAETPPRQPPDSGAHAETLCRTLLAAAPVAAFLTDLEGQCLYANPRWCQMAGLSPEQVLGEGWLNGVHPDDRAAVASGWPRLAAPRSEWVLEYRLMTPAGGVTWVHGLAVPQHDAQGRTAGYVGIGIDITESRRTAETREKQEAQERELQKTESLSRMAGAIAHHFNNRLQVVLGMLELALDDLPCDTAAHEALDAALNSAREAAKVGSQMLVYLGLAPGKREPLDLAEACRRHLPKLRATMPAKVVLETDLPSSGLVIHADTKQIQQVLTNLVTNAWEAVGDGHGTIRVTVETAVPADIPVEHRVPSEWRPQDKAYVCLKVTDSGCGIPPQAREALFDPFFSSKSTGRGLGLSVVKGITKSHGGVIAVESEPGQGTTFGIYLPRVDLGASPPPPATTASARLPRLAPHIGAVPSGSRKAEGWRLQADVSSPEPRAVPLRPLQVPCLAAVP
jgi:PAS domain S-box-containing protein